MKKLENMGKYIDHTILKADATEKDIIKLCAEAKEYGFASVCINPCNVSLAAEQLKGSDSLVCTVVGFPLGANDTKVKAFEAKLAVDDGAGEVDMVINIGKLKSGDVKYVTQDIRLVKEAVSPRAELKVIIECCLLTNEEKVNACKACLEAGADFVKTSTGFSTGGATVEDVKLMRDVVGLGMKIKAAGGIRDYKTAMAMIEAGADRIGASASIKIVKESQK